MVEVIRLRKNMHCAVCLQQLQKVVSSFNILAFYFFSLITVILRSRKTCSARCLIHTSVFTIHYCSFIVETYFSSLFQFILQFNV